MRRKDREITDKNEIMDIIDRSKVIRIAFTGEEYPYVLPFNFGYEEKDGRMICTPKVRHIWRCIFLWAKQEEKTKRTRQNSKSML